jgi:glucose dehydrogenase
LAFGGFGFPTASQAQTPASTPKESSDFASRIQDPNQWVVPTLDYANTRFSTLDQINTHNAAASY